MYSSLYIHVPFCAAKCDYCGFYSVCDQGGHADYLEHLEDEMARYSRECLPLESIFVGGGTPSLLTPEEWRRMDAAVKRYFTFAADCEYSTEANPESISSEHIECWRECGVNRVSMGIQAFAPEDRAAIGRRGTLNRLENIVSELDAAGIVRRNFDLIFNLPGQKPEKWVEALERAAALGATHISTYELMVEKGTPLAGRGVHCGDEESFLRLWALTGDTLGKLGFSRYEISNFARDREECRHNLNIWKGATYLGCGPAAWSFDGIERRGNPAYLELWLNNAPPEIDRLDKEGRAAEILAFGMRVVKGWTWQEYRNATGFDAIELRGKQLCELEKDGLVTLSDTGTAPTEKGLLFNDCILEKLCVL